MPKPRFHPIMDSLRKDQLDANLHEGKLRIENSWFEEDSPLDLSEGIQQAMPGLPHW